MIKNLTWLILILVLAVSCNTTNSNKKAQDDKLFLGMEPTDIPKLLAPELLATPVQEYNGTFTPDDKTFYFTTDTPEKAFITFTELLDDNSWSKPEVASFSGEYSDFDPLFSPDGKKLFFSSSRPLPDNQNSKIWFVEEINGAWGEPQRIVLTGEENREYYSSITNSGVIYFNIWSTGNIFKAEMIDEEYVVEELPEIVNGDYDKGDPFISPDEDYLIFRGYRDDSFGKGDLYISFKINGEWTLPENLGSKVNSSANEMCPYVTTDGKFFIFASNREIDISQTDQEKKQSYDNGQENIYYLSADFISDIRRKHAEVQN